MDRILKIEEAAAMLGRSRRNVLLLQSQGVLPRFVPLGRKRGRGIPESAVQAFIQSSVVAPAAAADPVLEISNPSPRGQ